MGVRVFRAAALRVPDRGGGRAGSHHHDPAAAVLRRTHGRQPVRRSGWLIGIYAACQLVSGPILGRWSDTMGRKPLLIASQIGTCVGFIVTAFAPNLWVLFVARAIDGVTAGNLSLAQAYISDVTGPRNARSRSASSASRSGSGSWSVPPSRACWRGFDYACRSSPRRRCRRPACSRPGCCCRR